MRIHCDLILDLLLNFSWNTISSSSPRIQALFPSPKRTTAALNLLQLLPEQS